MRMNMRWVVAVVWICVMAGVVRGEVGVGRLRCEWLANPLGIDTGRPGLGWVVQSQQRGQVQRAYQVVVASSRELLERDTGDLWDSGKVESAETLCVAYGGKELKSGQRCWWKVRVWDGEGKASGWSEVGVWSVGLLKAEDWEAKWINSKVRTTPAVRELGYHAAEAVREDEVKWVQVDLEKVVAIEQVRLHPVRQSLEGNEVEGFAFPVRFRVEVAEDEQFQTAKVIADHTGEDYANPGRAVVALDGKGTSARYVRVTATKLWNRGTGPRPFCFALAEVEAMAGGKNVALRAPVVALDSTEAHGWGKVKLTDGRGLVKTEVEEAIPAAIVLRKGFEVGKAIRRATVYVCGLGHYELYLNGRKVGDRVMEPGWTNYRKTCLYSTYDVTEMVRQGGNAMGVMLGNGMYNVVGGRYIKFTGSFGPPKAIVQLDIEYADGGTMRVVSDGSWKAAESPITFSCIYGGEDYDARKEQTGWDTGAFREDTRWRPVDVVDGPGGALRAQMMQAIKVRKTIKPVGTPRLVEGGCVYDLGQNFSGWVRVVVKGKAGAVVRLVPAERMNGDRADQSTSGGPTYWSYTLKGEGSESWRPRFNYSGFRFVKVEGAVPAGAGAGEMPVIEEIVGEVLYPDVETVGEFACSNELFNRVHQIINWAIVSNMKSVMTDCPHREKLGWLEEVHLMGPGIMFNYDVSPLYRKIADDMAEAQLENGLVPDIAPEYPVFAGGFRDSPEWGSACVIAPWMAYQRYGDRRSLEKHYDVMKRYAEYLGSKATDHIVSHGLGDWYDIGPRGPGPSQNTPMAVTATIIYYHDVVILQNVATLLGKSEEAERFTRLAEQIRTAFNQKFFNAETSQYATGSQTANAMAVVLGMVDEGRRAAVLENLVNDIRVHDNHTTAGDVGHRFVLRALAESGRSDVVFDMANRRDHPSYGYQVENGATSLTEAWDGPTRGASQNHFMLGHIEEWFYRDLAGIDVDLSRKGAERILIWPQVVGDVTWARARYDSAVGRIVSDWRIEGGKFKLKVTIPANAKAMVAVPAREAMEVTEGGRPANRAEGVRLVRWERGYAWLEVGSGEYEFESGGTK